MIDQHRPAISSLHLRSFLHVALWLRCRHLAKSIDTMHTTSISSCCRRALLGKGRVLRHVAPRDTEAEIARSVEIRGCPGRGLSIRFTGNHCFFFFGTFQCDICHQNQGLNKVSMGYMMGTSMGQKSLATIKHGHHHGIPRLLVTGGIRIDGENTVDSYLYIFIHVYASFQALVHHQPRFRTCSFFPLMAICHRLNFQDL